MNVIGLMKGERVLYGDSMSIENVQRSADTLCSCYTPCSRVKSSDITDVKVGEVPNLLSGYTETNSIHNRTAVHFEDDTLHNHRCENLKSYAVHFVLEDDDKK
jgi:hypothetical protein